MTLRMRHLVVGLMLSAALACADSGSTPTAPSSTAHVEIAAVTSPYVTWACAHASAVATAAQTHLWTVTQPAAAGCGPAVAATATANGALTGPAPTNFRATVTGNVVRLDWDYTGPGDGFQIEAGSAPGLSNLALARVPTSGTSTHSAVFGGVPTGVYFVRIAAYDAAGPATRSADIEVRVGTSPGPGCTSAPGAPGSLTSTVAGNAVTLVWTASAGDAPTSYVVEAGTATGLTNAAVLDTGSTALTLSATAPNGRYFVRVRGRNACGTGAASPEHVLDVGTSGPPPPPPPSCAYSVSPTTQSMIAAGGTATATVTTTAGCPWTATAQAAFLTVLTGASGAGPGTVTYAAAANTGSSARSGVLQITWSGGGQSLLVEQAGGPTQTLQAAFTVSPEPCPLIAGGGGYILNCSFDGTSSTGPIVSYEWLIGGVSDSGSAVNNRSVDCGFGGAGIRDVSLTVRDAQGRTSTATRPIEFRKDSGC